MITSSGELKIGDFSVSQAFEVINCFLFIYLFTFLVFLCISVNQESKFFKFLSSFGLKSLHMYWKPLYDPCMVSYSLIFKTTASFLHTWVEGRIWTKFMFILTPHHWDLLHVMWLKLVNFKHGNHFNHLLHLKYQWGMIGCKWIMSYKLCWQYYVGGGSFESSGWHFTPPQKAPTWAMSS